MVYRVGNRGDQAEAEGNNQAAREYWRSLLRILRMALAFFSLARSPLLIK